MDRSVVMMLVTGALVQLGYDLFQFYVPIHGHTIGLSASAIGGVLATLAIASFIVRNFLARLAEIAPETRRPTVSPPNTRVWLQPVSAAIGLPSTPRA